MASLFEHLRDDHQQIKRALLRLRSAPRGEAAVALLHELLRRYTAHARAEEHVFYSYMIHVKGVQQRALLGLEEHQRLDARLREAESVAPDDPRWRSTIVGLCDAIQQHLQDEESSLFTLARGALNERESTALGACFVAEQARIFRDISGLSESAAALAGSPRSRP
ncbi:hemerythrin domain-containing protein [Nannocystis pusilla]|uniref:Hemerythrin domain-containing protein n=1 Tax=Nannocystis pusilla TaxID=889268 RepID=A0ABS7TKI2_9BACT|nr:hemerythrin domain-containing protein [Nannocystis pusilla]MBZ5708632.1 hemerythrin domain-containing protein [Nannocystis pusilla]